MKSAFVALAIAGLSVTVPALAPAPAAAQAARQNPASTALAALFKKSDEDSLRRNPINALSRGDLRYAGRARRLSFRRLLRGRAAGSAGASWRRSRAIDRKALDA